MRHLALPGLRCWRGKGRTPLISICVALRHRACSRASRNISTGNDAATADPSRARLAWNHFLGPATRAGSAAAEPEKCPIHKDLCDLAFAVGFFSRGLLFFSAKAKRFARRQCFNAANGDAAILRHAAVSGAWEENQ